MKHMPLLFILFLSTILMGCQETTKTNNSSASNNYCQYNPYAPGCYGGGNNGTFTTGGNAGGTTGTVDCTIGNNYWQSPSCTGYSLCQSNPSSSNLCPNYNGAPGTTTGGMVGGSYPGGPNPFPFYYSGYVDKNWKNQYPYIPSINCSEATAPSGVTYTPYETRKGTITLKGQVDYNPASGQAFFATTSDLLQTAAKARDFFWGDSTLKVRFKSNIQPSSANTTAVCPGRVSNLSSIKGYGKIRFDLYLVGRKASGAETNVYLGNKTVDVNSCTPALDLSSYAEQYPNGIYLKVQNVQGNQDWSPGTNYESMIYDYYGFIYPQNPYVSGTWKAIRNAECWSLDIEVAADGTKTFN